jgi:hypothetical protein
MDDELERTQDNAGTEVRSGPGSRAQLGDWAQSLRAKAGRARSAVSPWVQGLLSREAVSQESQGTARSPRGGWVRRGRHTALTQHHTQALLNRVSRKPEAGRVWRPDVGSVSPGTFARFAGEIAQRFPSVAQKYRLEVPESVGEEGDLTLAPVGILVRGAVPAYTRPAGAGPAAQRAETQPGPPSPQPSPPPRPSVQQQAVARAPRQFQRKPGVRAVSRVEEITPGATTPVRAEPVEARQKEPPAAAELPQEGDGAFEPAAEHDLLAPPDAVPPDLPSEAASLPVGQPEVQEPSGIEEAGPSPPPRTGVRPSEPVRRAPLPADGRTAPDSSGRPTPPVASRPAKAASDIAPVPLAPPARTPVVQRDVGTGVPEAHPPQAEPSAAADSAAGVVRPEGDSPPFALAPPFPETVTPVEEDLRRKQEPAVSTLTPPVSETVTPVEELPSAVEEDLRRTQESAVSTLTPPVSETVTPVEELPSAVEEDLRRTQESAVSTLTPPVPEPMAAAEGPPSPVAGVLRRMQEPAVSTRTQTSPDAPVPAGRPAPPQTGGLRLETEPTARTPAPDVPGAVRLAEEPAPGAPESEIVIPVDDVAAAREPVVQESAISPPTAEAPEKGGRLPGTVQRPIIEEDRPSPRQSASLPRLEEVSGRPVEMPRSPSATTPPPEVLASPEPATGPQAQPRRSPAPDSVSIEVLAVQREAEDVRPSVAGDHPPLGRTPLPAPPILGEAPQLLPAPKEAEPPVVQGSEATPPQPRPPEAWPARRESEGERTTPTAEQPPPLAALPPLEIEGPVSMAEPAPPEPEPPLAATYPADRLAAEIGEPQVPAAPRESDEVSPPALREAIPAPPVSGPLEPSGPAGAPPVEAGTVRRAVVLPREAGPSTRRVVEAVALSLEAEPPAAEPAVVPRLAEAPLAPPERLEAEHTRPEPMGGVTEVPLPRTDVVPIAREPEQVAPSTREAAEPRGQPVQRWADTSPPAEEVPPEPEPYVGPLPPESHRLRAEPFVRGDASQATQVAPPAPASLEQPAVPFAAQAVPAGRPAPPSWAEAEPGVPTLTAVQPEVEEGSVLADSIRARAIEGVAEPAAILPLEAAPVPLEEAPARPLVVAPPSEPGHPLRAPADPDRPVTPSVQRAAREAAAPPAGLQRPEPEPTERDEAGEIPTTVQPAVEAAGLPTTERGGLHSEVTRPQMPGTAGIEKPAPELGADFIARAASRGRMLLTEPMWPQSPVPGVETAPSREPWISGVPARQGQSPGEPAALLRSMRPPAALPGKRPATPVGWIESPVQEPVLAGKPEAEERPVEQPQPSRGVAPGAPAPVGIVAAKQVPSGLGRAAAWHEPLPLAPVVRSTPAEALQRQPERISPGPVTVQLDIEEPPEPAAEPEQQGEARTPAQDLEALAREVYPVIKRMLAIERERTWSR